MKFNGENKRISFNLMLKYLKLPAAPAPLEIFLSLVIEGLLSKQLEMGYQ
jgi:hypothetical protein